MSEHKWDRIKRAFGSDPSDDLIAVRDQKIKDELAKVDAAINKIAGAGLGTGVLQQQRDTVERARRTALALKSNREKDPALDKVKMVARNLVSVANSTADKLIADQDKELEAARKAVAAPVKAAKALKQPLCKTAVDVPLRRIEQAIADAEHEDDNQARLEALEAVDTAPLDAVLAKAKKIESNISALQKVSSYVRSKVEKLPDGPAKTGFNEDLQEIDEEKDDFANEADIDELQRRTQEAVTAVNKVGEAVNQAVNDYERVAKLRQLLEPLIAQAKGIPSKVGKSVVGAALIAVEQQVTAAELKPTDKEIGDELKKIDTKPLVLALASARDLDQGVPALLKTLTASIDKVTDGRKQTELRRELQRIDGIATGLVNQDDLETVRKGYAAARRAADALMGEVIKARNPDGYEDALKARFGVDVTQKEGAKVNLIGAYEMLALVPDSHVGHDKLTKLNFTGSKEGGGAYGKGAIDMDNFGSGNDGYVYEIDGKKQKPNGFNVCMLHEIGHAVDDKYGIMAGLMEKAGYGNWKTESKESVQAEFVKAALADLKNPGEPLATKVNTLIGEALGGKEASKPDEANKAQWKLLKKYTDIAFAITEKKKPWFSATPSDVVVNNRVYVQSYSAEWNSYAMSEHAGNTVRDYQWRAPGEWFADLYGICWMTKKAPPSGIGPAVARWFPG
ncbi:MAG TPA: hypothetical protein VFG62_16650 [Rhodopila sp.]|nr:hypothetical protein [Rhodopila sp.]